MSIVTEITRLQTAKDNLKTSINAQGGTLTTETLDDYYLAVDNLPVLDTSDATAVAGEILATKTAYVDGSKVTGTMVNRGSLDTNITEYDDVITFLSGYTTGGTITISPTEKAKFVSDNIKSGITLLGVSGSSSVVETNDGNAGAGDMLSGKTAYVNGNKITGNITSKGAETFMPSTSNQTISSGQYLSGTQTISGDADLVAGNIKSGVTIFNVEGTYTGSTPTDGTATAADINKGKTAYSGNPASKLTGTARIYTPLATNVGIGAMEGDTSPQSYDWSTQFTAWNGKTILIEWATTNDGGTGVTFSLFGASVAANSSGVKVGFVNSSSTLLLTGTTSNASSTTQIAFTPSSLTGLDYLELTMNVYEVI